LSGWNRLFVVVAICWMLVAPFLLMAETNRPIERVKDLCTDTAYNSYGSSSSVIRLDMAKYDAEVKSALTPIYVTLSVPLSCSVPWPVRASENLG
jgi:hypothetical protein